MKRLAPFFVILILSIPSQGAADPLTTDPLTFDGALHLALENNETIKMARERVLQGGYAVDGAYSYLMPELTVESRYNRYTKEESSASGFTVQPEDSTSVELRLTQPLYSGGKAAALIAQAKKRRASADAYLDGAREGVVMAAALAYYGALRAEKAVEINVASLKRAGEQKRVAAARLKVGNGTRAEVLRALAEEAGARAALAIAPREVLDAYADLGRVTGFDTFAEGFSVTEPSRPFEVLGLPVADLVEVALSKRWDYGVKVTDVSIAGDGIDYAKSRYKPDLDLEGVYTYRDQTPKTTFFIEDSAYAGLKLTIPFYDGGEKKAGLSDAKSRHREAELSRRDLARQVELDVRRAHNSLAAAAPVIESFREQLAFSSENYDMIFKRYSLGAATTVDLIDAETLLVDAEMGLMRAELDRDVSVLRLMKATGTLLDEIGEERGRVVGSRLDKGD